MRLLYREIRQSTNSGPMRTASIERAAQAARRDEIVACGPASAAFTASSRSHLPLIWRPYSWIRRDERNRPLATHIIILWSEAFLSLSAWCRTRCVLQDARKMLLKRGQTMNGLSVLLRPALLVAALALLMGPVVQAAGSAAIRDDAGLFTSAGRSSIERAADQNNVRVVVITNNQSFSKSAWHAWLRSQATDPNAITMGLHAVPHQKNVYVVPGANTGISQAQANQGVRETLPTFNSSRPAEGVIQLIQVYHSMGATAPAGARRPDRPRPPSRRDAPCRARPGS